MPKWTKEQEDAIYKAGKNIIVSAGAGSGKTAVLSERVLKKLENGVNIDELLVLTFTRAAAEEMKDRIRKKITDNPELTAQRDLINSAYITTFDSFALSTLKKYHYLLNITNDIKITDESIVTIKKKEIMNDVFLENYTKKDENFLAFVDKYTVKNDNALKNLMLGLAKKLEGTTDRDSAINKDAEIEKVYEEYLEVLKKKVANVKAYYENMNYYFDSKYMEKLSAVIVNIINIKEQEDLIRVSKPRLPNAPSGTDEEAKKSKDELKRSIDELFLLKEYGTKEDIINNIVSTKNDIEVIRNILKEYFDKLEVYKKNNNIYTFNDIALLSIKVLKEFPEAREELKNKFKEIMIDEYQDTNDIQEEFISLIARDNVYMVGDIKQSIYRFRGSNPDIFKEKYDAYQNEEVGIKIDLIKNFRSRENVLESINRIFDLLMDKDIGGAEYIKSHEMVYGNRDYDEKKESRLNYYADILEYEKCEDYTDSEIEIFTIAKDIKDKVQNKYMVYDKDTGEMRMARYSDFVIILDRSKYFDDYKRIFEYFDIPLTILKDGKLNNSDDILLIKNMIDFVIRVNNKDFGVELKYDFLSIGKSFLYEYTDEYMFECLTNNKIFSTSLYDDLSLVKAINSKTSAEILEEVLATVKFYDKLEKQGDYENIFVRVSKIYDLAFSLGNASVTPEDFISYLDEIIKSDIDINYSLYDGGEESVKILTIHKSKGLEYPICYFADLNHKFNDEEKKETFIYSKDYGFILPYENKDTVLKYLYLNKVKEEDLSERIRLFYVALTRAREKIIIVLPKKDTKKLNKNENGTIVFRERIKFNKLSDLVYSSSAYLTNYVKYVDIDGLGLTKNYLYSKEIKPIDLLNKNICVEEINIEKEYIDEEHFSKNSKELISKEKQENMEYGTKFHEYLELADFNNFNIDDIDDLFIAKGIKNFLDSDLLKTREDAKIYKEYEFIYEDGNKEYRGIIDLMLEYSDHIDIIDYKLKNTVDSAYIKQISGYKKYIESISKKKVNTYLYSILNSDIIRVS